jgi:acetyltransferase EpsM
VIKLIGIIGAGGHAKVILDILEKKRIDNICFFDDQKTGDFEGYPIWGKVSDIKTIIKQENYMEFIIAIGDNTLREKIANELEPFQIKYKTAIHPSAQIGKNVFIHEGTVVMANAVINSSTIIGKHCIINTSSSVDHDCTIDDFVHISPGVNIAGGVKVGKASHIGTGASVIPQIEIGYDTTIGAGAVVINNIPSNVIAVGCPAKIIKKKGEQ